MTKKELIHLRQHNQQLCNATFATPAELVYWMGAIQAQDYAMAKWAIGLRIKNATDLIIEDAISKGEILRTHLLRPTWHFVHAADIRWMLKLTAPQIQRQMVYYDRQLEVDKKELLRSIKLFEKTLSGEKQMTRKELSEVFTKAKFNCEGMRFGHLLMHAELDGILCSGALKGKQISYTLLEERVRKHKDIGHEESLAKLAHKYFQSHGPATIKDFIWWSGLPATSAKEAISLLDDKIRKVSVAEEYYFFIESEASTISEAKVILLPNYDEYIVGYTNREFLIGDGIKEKLSRAGNPVFTNTVLVNGVISGSWKRELKQNSLSVTSTMFNDVSPTVNKKISQAKMKFENFLIIK